MRPIVEIRSCLMSSLRAESNPLRSAHPVQGAAFLAYFVDEKIPWAHIDIAGVANAGRDRNWTGHDFAQANWYAFGRLAWDPGLGAADIADEWIRKTWSQAPEVVAAIKSVMLESREALVHVEITFNRCSLPSVTAFTQPK